MATTKKVVKKSSTAVSTVADQEVLNANAAAFPAEERKQFISFPRLRMVAKDQTDGTGKNMKVTVEAGTFFTEVQDKEETEVEEEVKQKNGKTKTETVKKRLWESTELGRSIEGIIIYQRYQLKFWDKDHFVSSAIYDKGDTDIPLFEFGKEIARGTPDQLKAPYNELQKGTDGKKDRTVSKLKDERILFVWFTPEDGEPGVYQMSIKGTSMYNYLKYTSSVTIPNVVTNFDSIADSRGSNNFNTMTFSKVRDVTAEEAGLIRNTQDFIAGYVAEQKAAFANRAEEVEGAQDNIDKF